MTNVMPTSPILNVEDLKSWLAKKLEPICDADPVPLAKYVVALAKKDKPKDELKTFCNDQLEVFLQNATAKFVDELFEALASKAYIPDYVPPVEEVQPPLPAYEPTVTVPSLPPGAPPLPPEENVPEPPANSIPVIETEVPLPEEPPEIPKELHVEIEPSPPTNTKGRRSKSRSPINRNHSPRNRSRSRSFSPRRGRREDDRRPRRDDRSDRGRYDRRGGPYPDSRYYRDRYGGRARDTRRGRDFKDIGRDRYEGRPYRDDDRYSNNRRHDSPPRRTPPPNTSVNSVVTIPGQQSPARGRPRCRDFDEKGFCMKGELCPYDHGVDPVIVEDLNLPTVLGIPQQQNDKPPPPLPPLQHQPPPPPLPPPDMPPHPLGLGGPHMRPGMFMRPPMPFGRPPGPNLPVLPPGFHHDPRLPPPQPLPPGVGQPLPMPEPPRPPFPGIPPEQPPYSQRLQHFPPPEPPREEPEYNPEDPGMDNDIEDEYRDHMPIRVPSGNLRTLVDIKPAEPAKEEKADEKMDVSASLEPMKSVHKEPSPGRTVIETIKPFSQPLNENVSDLRRFVVESNSSLSNNLDGNRTVLQATNKVPDLRQRLNINKHMGRKYIPNNRTLEVKKIPRELNNIAKLNEHFHKFGTIVNLQVAFNGDPGAALITFATHPQAKNAHNSTDAILSNRFIKVFWHSPEDSEYPSSTSGPSSASPQMMNRERIVIPPKSQLAVVRNHPAADKGKPPLVQATGSGITRTVYNQAVLKTSEEMVKNAVDAAKKLALAKESMNKKKEEARKLALQKQVTIQKQKQELMKQMILKQKDLIEKMDSRKSVLSAEARHAIMGSLKTLTASIEKTKKELTGNKASTPKSKAEAQKELLDTELELYNQQTEGADTSELRIRVAALRREAHALGLLSRRGGARRGRGGAIPGRGRGRGIIQRRRSSRTKTVLDKRPRELQVSGFSPTEKDEVLVYLNGYGDFDHIDYKEESNTYVVSYRTRSEAEMAISKGSMFKGKHLSMSWHVKQEEAVLQAEDEINTDAFEDNEETHEDEDSLLLGDDDDEEEESESRAWRR